MQRSADSESRAPKSDPAISVDALTVERGGKEVLKAVNCSIARGTAVGLLGPSGSGKSTMMRSIVGVQRIRSGRVTVLGRDAGSAELRDKVGYMTQAPSIYLDLTVRENARYFASLYNEGEDAAERAIASVGLEQAAGQLVRTLSGGQLSRASLACTLLGEPQVLILDEPTVGQDPVLRDELWQRFHGLVADGATLVVSSHVMDEARRCDRLILISEGTVIAEGAPQEVMASVDSDDMDEAFLRLVLAKRSRQP